MTFLRIARHEFRYHFWCLQTLVLGGLLFGLAFLFTANGVEFQTTARGGNVHVNSPYIIAHLHALLSLLAVFITPSFLARAVLKDAENRFDGILFATPIAKGSYFWGRFVGAYGALIAVLAAGPMGMVAGTFWPAVIPGTLGPNHVSHYLITFAGIVMPSVLIASSLVFSAAIVSRSLLHSYLAAIGLLILYLAAATSKVLTPLWDPFLIEALSEQTRYWTAAERNLRLPEFTGVLLANRWLWTALAGATLAAAYRLFRFRTPAAVTKTAVTKKNPASPPTQTSTPTTSFALATGSAPWQRGTHLQQLLFRTRFEIGTVVGSLPFLLLMALSLFLLIVSLMGRETLYDVDTYPVTRILLDAIQRSLSLALMIVLAFYSADLVWRERSCRFSEVLDTLPAPNWVFVVSKLAALVVVLHAIVLLGIVIAICLQVVSGYEDFQLDLYLGRGLIYFPMPHVFLGVLACFFQVLVKNRGLGILLFVAFIALIALSRDIFGVEHPLLSYGLPGVVAPLSDMNRDGSLAAAGWWVRAYWGSIAGLLLLMTYVLWNRGTLQPLKYRLRRLRMFRSRGFAVPAFGFMALLGACAATIFYNTNVLNPYWTERDVERLQVRFEREYRQFEDLPMPRIVDVHIEVDLFPDRRRLEARGVQTLRNKSEQEIRTIHLIFPLDAQVPRVEIEGAVQTSVDEALGYYVFDLKTPMLPGQERTLRFETVLQRRGFTHARPDLTLVRNGTFINNQKFTPYVGFCTSMLISDRNTRRRLGLPPLPRLPDLEDPKGRRQNYLRQDSDFISLETTVSTVVGQTAISPGTLVKEWIEADRHYFTYRMDRPIGNFYSVLSADYEVVRDRSNDVEIEVFHHGPHAYNVGRMIESVKDSLAYYQQAFGPYPDKVLRIVEFPGYRKFAQAFPTMIPFSEDIGFLADVSDPQELDLPYYVTAHEVAHQWWGHQVMAAHTQGATLLLESLAQYGALLVMEQKYGKHHVRRFLKDELDRYLSGRAEDAEGERPLSRVEDQPYVHYRKGSLILYGLRDYVGEEVVNRALRRLLQDHGFAASSDAPAYPTAATLLAYLKEEAGPEHHGLIEDFFEKITLYDVRLDDATVEALADGRFKVSLDVAVAKFYADPLGNETSVPFDVSVDLGLFLESPASEDFRDRDVITLAKHAIPPNGGTIELVVDQKPRFAGIDPYNKLIDRNSNDNLRPVT